MDKRVVLVELPELEVEGRREGDPHQVGSQEEGDPLDDSEEENHGCHDHQPQNDNLSKRLGEGRVIDCLYTR